ncbi:hypothetical protein [Embleya sp. NBC_00896]|uniref:hypothetical protein n=1 Tax=Embleya sp. NBC_00896 TaxID=2975961 RepID=UPI002F90A7D4|nr:hypothetical protein OG928_45410 [Embleya sp. NBC_00896]
MTTFQKLINGRSVFGVVGDDREHVDLGVVVVDDPRVALATTEDVFRLAFSRDHPAFEPLEELFADALKAQSASVWPTFGRRTPPRRHASPSGSGRTSRSTSWRCCIPTATTTTSSSRGR